ncbi:MAG: nuclease domain-containing protein [Succinivibrionaceae bacterium]
MADFELRYIRPNWKNPNEVGSIDKAQECIEIEQESKLVYSANTLAYIRIDGNKDAYIGLKILSNSIHGVPYILKPDGSTQSLRRINPISDEQDVWWVIADKWNKTTNEYDSKIFNTMGNVVIKIEDYDIRITNDAINFKFKDLEYIIQDFKNTLLQIIFDKNSIASYNICNENGPQTISSNISSCFGDIEKCLSNIEKILKNPNKKVLEDISFRELSRAKVIPQTITDIIKRKRLVSSKSYREDYSTPENKYIHYCLNRIIFVLNQLKININFRNKYAEDVLLKAETEKEEYFRGEYKHIDKIIVQRQVQWAKDLCQNCPREICVPNDQDSYKCKTISFYITGVCDKISNAFFVKNVNFNYETNIIIVPINTYLEIKKVFGTIISSKKPIYCSFNAIYEAIPSSTKVQIGKIYSAEIEPENLKELESYLNNERLIDGVFKEDILKNNEEQLKYTENNKNNYENEIKNKSIDLEKIQKLLNKSYILEKLFKKKNIGSQSSYPMSVVLATNHSYKNFYDSYNCLSSNLGINEKVINILQRIDRFGLTEIYNVYEYWCLLTIIKVLTQKLKFRIEKNWDEKLLSNIFTKGKNQEVSFNFKNFNTRITLHYQMHLQNLRPDFVLELDVWDGTKITKKKLVIDAKFRGNVYNEQIDDLVSQMYEKYSEDGNNNVFVMHSSFNAMKIKNEKGEEECISVSPLKWGMFSSYGGEEQRNLSKGHILVLPSPKYPASIDNLQRLIGGFIQQNSYINPENVNQRCNCLCINCGSSKLNIDVLGTSERKKFFITCKECGLTVEENHCFGCGREKIYKNGLWWTYQITYATQLTNVICPCCGSFF